MLAKARSIDGYENMSRQQLESTFTAMSKPKPKPTSKSASNPKKCTPAAAARCKKHTSIPILNVHFQV